MPPHHTAFLRAQTADPYTVTRGAVHGPLGSTRSMQMISMPQADFIDAIHKAVCVAIPDHEEAELCDELRDELYATAACMDRFPLGTWFDRQRGCGCLVGEWLVAHAELEELADHASRRAAVIDAYEMGGLWRALQLTRGDRTGQLLFRAGNEADAKIRAAIKRNNPSIDLNSCETLVVIIPEDA